MLDLAFPLVVFVVYFVFVSLVYVVALDALAPCCTIEFAIIAFALVALPLLVPLLP